ncbi:hypothetical protein MTO96_019171 [Rhipicephalus appendiculatus]
MHAVDHAGTVDSGNTDTSPVIPAEPDIPLTQPLGATEHITEACVKISSEAQGASRSGSVSSLEAPALSTGQLLFTEAAVIESSGTDSTGNGPLPNTMDLPLPTNQVVCATTNNMNTANTTSSSCTAKHNIEKSCLPNTGVAASGTDRPLMPAIESMELFCRQHFTSEESVQSGYLQCDEHSASRVARLQLHSSHTDSSRVHPIHADGPSSRNALPQNSWEPSRHAARPVWPLAGNMGTSDSNASFDTVSLVDTVFGISSAAIDTTNEGHAGQGGMLCQLLEEYVQNIERLLVSLSECTPSYRDELVSALLPNGVVGLKTIVQLVWRMEAELQCLGSDRVSDLDKGVFSLLTEHAANFSKMTAEQDLPAFMTFEVRIEPQLPTLADPPGQDVADDGQHTNCGEVHEDHTEFNCAADVASEAVGQPGRASTVSVTSSADCAVTKTADDAAILIVDDPDQEEEMAEVRAASGQRTIAGVQTNSMQGLGSTTGLQRPSNIMSEEGEMAGQQKSPQASTVDMAIQGTAHTTATVDASPLQQGQLSAGVSFPPRAATGVVQNRVLYNALTAKPKNLDAVSNAKVSQGANAMEATRVQTDAADTAAATSISSSDRHRLPSTEKAAQHRQQRWDQGPKTAHSANRNSVLSAGTELDSAMDNRQQQDSSALRSPLKWPRANFGDTSSTAQQSSLAPKRKVAKVSSEQSISQVIPSSQNSRQGQQAHSNAGRPEQVRRGRFELRDPPPLMALQGLLTALLGGFMWLLTGVEEQDSHRLMLQDLFMHRAFHDSQSCCKQLATHTHNSKSMTYICRSSIC